LDFPTFKACALNRDYLLSDKSLQAVFRAFDTEKKGVLRYSDMQKMLNGGVDQVLACNSKKQGDAIDFVQESGVTNKSK
jgi:Ca2+-binding EF-hand superfamily protein